MKPNAPKAEAVALMREGLTDHAIHRRTRVGRVALAIWRKEAGIPPHPRGNRTPNPLKAARAALAAKRATV